MIAALAKRRKPCYSPVELTYMPQCIVTGKKPTTGMNVSHSNRHTKRWLYPSVSKRRLMNPATGRYVTVVISNRGLRTLKKWDAEGKKYDLAQMKQDCE